MIIVYLDIRSKSYVKVKSYKWRCLFSLNAFYFLFLLSNGNQLRRETIHILCPDYDTNDSDLYSVNNINDKFVFCNKFEALLGFYSKPSTSFLSYMEKISDSVSVCVSNDLCPMIDLYCSWTNQVIKFCEEIGGTLISILRKIYNDSFHNKN